MKVGELVGPEAISIRDIASRLKAFTPCHACVVEGQERYCRSHDARWLGRELLRILAQADLGNHEEPEQ